MSLRAHAPTSNRIVKGSAFNKILISDRTIGRDKAGSTTQPHLQITISSVRHVRHIKVDRLQLLLLIRTDHKATVRLVATSSGRLNVVVSKGKEAASQVNSNQVVAVISDTIRATISNNSAASATSQIRFLAHQTTATEAATVAINELTKLLNFNSHNVSN